MMNLQIRLFRCFLILSVLSACSFINPTQSQLSTATSTATLATDTPLPTLTSTITPKPSATLTPTIPPPTATPTFVSTPTQTSTSMPLTAQLNIFDDLWSIVNDTYVYPDFNGLDWNAVKQQYTDKIKAGLSTDQFYLAMEEMINSLGDEHSAFLNPQQVAAEEVEYQGKMDYVGIGILVSAVPARNHAVILTVFDNSPAEAAGLKPRDSIISVGGVPILDSNGYLQDIVRGPEGTTISIKVQTPGEAQRDIDITRHRITGQIPVVHSVLTSPNGKRIGYILLVTFNDSTVDEHVAEAIKDMTAEAPLDGLILDNRMNKGGSSAVLEPVLSNFLGGTVGYYIDRNEERPLQIRINDINGSSKVPLVVLVGSGTESFGEIFAGILQDFGRAYLIGKTTVGNVEILLGYDLDDGSRVWLANETFRPYNHPEQNWEKTGIIPDKTVQGEFDEYTLENDPAVIAGIQYLSGK